jgi:hypothetical protein
MKWYTGLRVGLGLVLLVAVAPRSMGQTPTEDEFFLKLGFWGVPVPDSSRYELVFGTKVGASPGFVTGEDDALPVVPPEDVSLAWFTGYDQTYVRVDIRPPAASLVWNIQVRRAATAAPDVTLSWEGPDPASHQGRLVLEDPSTGATRDLRTPGTYVVNTTRMLRITYQLPPAAEVSLEGNRVSITNGNTTPALADHTDFGVTTPGRPVSRTFTVKNLGMDLLTCGVPSLPTGFTLTEALSSTIGAGGSDTFTVQLGATAAGTFGGSVSFSTNDGDENPFHFAIRGQVAGPVPPTGTFQAEVDAAAVGDGEGWWDLGGLYNMPIAGHPMVLSLVHDTKGTLTGKATYAVAQKTVLEIPVKGTAKGSASNVVVKIALKGADAEKTLSASLSINMTVSAAARQLAGGVTGKVTINGETTPVSTAMALPIPPPMNDTWALLLDLAQDAKGIGGTALLTLSNGVDYAFAVKGKAGSNGAAVLSLAGDPSDPAAKAIRIKTTITPLVGGAARIESFSGKGYGETVTR